MEPTHRTARSAPSPQTTEKSIPNICSPLPCGPALLSQSTTIILGHNVFFCHQHHSFEDSPYGDIVVSEWSRTRTRMALRLCIDEWRPEHGCLCLRAFCISSRGAHLACRHPGLGPGAAAVKTAGSAQRANTCRYPDQHNPTEILIKRLFRLARGMGCVIFELETYRNLKI